MISGTLAFAAEKAGRVEAAVAEYEALKSKGDGNTAYLDYKIGVLKSKPQSLNACVPAAMYANGGGFPAGLESHLQHCLGL